MDDEPLTWTPGVRFTIRNCTAAGEVEVLSTGGAVVWKTHNPEPSEQAKLWDGTWPRLQPMTGRHDVVVVDGYALRVHRGTGPYGPPRRPPFRVIEGGKT